MAAIPGGIDADRGPPMAVPLGHFVVGLGFLLLGGVAGAANAVGTPDRIPVLAHVHLLLVGWVCVTIMGAMTQFVPVWSGTRIHSRRLARTQLRLVTAGLLGFAGSLVVGAPGWLAPFGGLLIVGFWVFVYNVGRTLLRVRPWDVTERHFALAIGFFVAATLLGFLLAVGFGRPVFDRLPVDRGGVRAAHATLAVFGVVLTTVFGALYQLATMFTQSELRGVERYVRGLEEVGFPAGVALLATARLVDAGFPGRLGGALIVASVAGFGAVLARRLHETRVEWTPMLSRYAVAAAAMVAWAALAAPAWLRDPLGPAALYGAPGTTHLVVLGVIGFVVFGTLYHAVPFIVWVDRYSDRLGLEDVPMIDDLYDDRLARVDLACLVAGTAGLVAADLLGLPTAVTGPAAAAFVAGSAAFVGNLLLVLRRHSSRTLTEHLVAGIALGNPDGD